jgi:hypothetical protein
LATFAGLLSTPRPRRAPNRRSLYGIESPAEHPRSRSRSWSSPPPRARLAAKAWDRFRVAPVWLRSS